MAAKLSTSQREKIQQYIRQYKSRLKKELSEKGWKKERDDRERLYQALLSKESVEKLTERDLRKIIKDLWATQFWTNKDYLVQKVLQNGLEKIRVELKDLLYGEAPIEQRFDRFSVNIKGLGPSSITEILVFVFPDKYSLWNDKPKNVLPLLGMKDLLPERVYKYGINGRDYRKCTHALSLVRDELEKSGFGKVDFLDVDIFMWLLFSEIIKKERRPGRPKKTGVAKESISRLKIDSHSSSCHWDVMAMLIDLGNLLGFETYTADPGRKSSLFGKNLKELAKLKEIPGFTYQDTLEIVRNIDVIWFQNEYPKHCFEVEHTTNIRDGLLRLFQISALEGVGFFVVAPGETLERFAKEIARRPFKKMKDRYTFKGYKELEGFYNEASIYHKLRKEFLEGSGFT